MSVKDEKFELNWLGSFIVVAITISLCISCLSGDIVNSMVKYNESLCEEAK